MRSLHHIEVDRASGEKSLATALDYLKAGEAVGIFPEATISRAMELKEFKSGAVRIAAEAGVPLVPVIMWGTQRMMTKDHPRDFSRGKTIAITVGEPMHPTPSRQRGRPDRRAARADERDAGADRLRPTRPRSSRPAPGGCRPGWAVRRRRLDEAADLDVAEKRERARRRAAKRAAKK